MCHTLKLDIQTILKPRPDPIGTWQLQIKFHGNFPMFTGVSGKVPHDKIQLSQCLAGSAQGQIVVHQLIVVVMLKGKGPKLFKVHAKPRCGLVFAVVMQECIKLW
ncbi:hypothetical protein GL2_19980 [Microbulbifer sp. GL-2]|nr:hypothetical protein GL2_19980 [Microbulbifer sp. GL-2]